MFSAEKLLMSKYMLWYKIQLRQAVSKFETTESSVDVFHNLRLFLLRPSYCLDFWNFRFFFAYFYSLDIQKYCPKRIFWNSKRFRRYSLFCRKMSLVSTYKHKISNAFFSKPRFQNWCPLYLRFLWTDFDETKTDRRRIDAAIVLSQEIILKFFHYVLFTLDYKKKGEKCISSCHFYKKKISCDSTIEVVMLTNSTFLLFFSDAPNFRKSGHRLYTSFFHALLWMPIAVWTDPKWAFSQFCIFHNKMPYRIKKKY